MFRWPVQLVCCGYIVSITTVNCITCPVNCQTCSNNDDVPVCTSCNNGYWLYQSSCQPCPDNCATCSNATSCGTCKPGFYSPHSFCNVPCSTNCFGNVCHENTGHCSSCPSNRYGYFCDLDCGLCKDKQCDLKQCTDGCKGGYWQYQDGDYFECRACMDNCSSCDVWSICDVCNDGTYRSEVSGTRNYCLLCRPGCVTCSSFNSCSTCKPGYFGGACELSCSALVPDCSLCDWDGGSAITCTQCVDGFTRQDNNCVVASQPCPNNCKRCTEDNVCEICKTGWYGAACNKPCHYIPNCVACQETGGFLVCNTCLKGYIVLDGECSVPSTNNTTLPAASSPYTSTSTTLTPILTATKTSKTSTNSAVPDYNTSHPQSQNTGFQTSTFVIGLVTGLGICACIILVVGLVWFFRRRRRLLQPATSRLNESFYENSVTTNEINPTTVSYHGPQPENIQEMHVVTENVSESMEDNRQAPVYEESVPTSTDLEQHVYTSLNVRQGEHIYKDLTS